MGADYKKRIKQVLLFHSGVTQIPQNVTRDFLMGFNSATATISICEMPIAGIFRNMYVRTDNAPAGADTVTVTLRVNGLLTALQVVITGAAVRGQDLVDAVAIAPGDYIHIRAVTSATCANQRISVGIEFDPI